MAYNTFKKWASLSPEIQNNARTKEYADVIKQCLIGNIDFKADEINTYIALSYAIDGACIIDKDFNLYHGTLTDVPNNDGSWDGLEVVAQSYYNADVFNGTVGKDCEVLFFNPRREPEHKIWRYAHQLGKNDLFQKYALEHGMTNGLIPVKDIKTKKAIEEAVKRQDVGYPNTFVSEDELYTELINGERRELKPIDLNDPNAITKLQYSNEYHNHLIGRLSNLYGHPNFTSTKHAQVVEGEISGALSVSQLYNKGLMTTMQKCVEKCNKLLGTSWTIDWCDVQKAIEHDALYDDKSGESEDENNE